MYFDELKIDEFNFKKVMKFENKTSILIINENVMF